MIVFSKFPPVCYFAESGHCMHSSKKMCAVFLKQFFFERILAFSGRAEKTALCKTLKAGSPDDSEENKIR